jgi:GNAT superfamily N-acetyltransferase
LVALTQLEIRTYLPTDRESCRRLWKELTEWHRQIYHDQSIGGPHPEDSFDKHLENVGEHNLWVAVLESVVVGLIGLIVNDQEAEIEPLIVSRPHRTRSIGRRLIEKVVDEARGRGLRFLSVKPVARNVEGIMFFYNRGFRNIGQVELFMDFSEQWVGKKGLKFFHLQFNY